MKTAGYNLFFYRIYFLLLYTIGYNIKSLYKLKITFEENDAGFQYGTEIKGRQDYEEDHTNKFIEKAKPAK